MTTSEFCIILYMIQKLHLIIVFIRGTQRLFSVKYRFGEAHIAWNFLLLEDGKRFLDDRSIHVQFSKLVL